MDICNRDSRRDGALVPALPFLVKAGEKGAEAIGQQLGAGVWETAGRCGVSSGRRSKPADGGGGSGCGRRSRGRGYPSRAAGTVRKLLEADKDLFAGLAQVLEAAGHPQHY